MTLLLITLYAMGALVAFFACFIFFLAQRKFSVASAQILEADKKLKNIKKDIDTEKRESLIRIKDEIYKKRNEFELEIKREKLDIDRLRNKLNNKYEVIEKKEMASDDLRRELQQKERDLLYREDSMRSNENKIKSLYTELISKLERVSNMTRSDAKQSLLETLKSEVALDNQKWIRKVSEETAQVAKSKAIDIIVNAMQRYTSECVSSNTSSIIQLPTDDMKGRIIGKEGRNIKALEMATGMEFIIGEIPEIITISGFNPIRREVAKLSLERLISDGRINPTRIEEMVELVGKEVEEIIQEYGKNTILEFNLQGVHPEIVTLLGKLYFRTSYSQNVLQHSKEVGVFSSIIAEELGLDGKLALRCGLLHDIGKAVTAEVEGPHATIGGDIAKRCGENSIVVNAISAHHEEVPFSSIYAAIVVISDTISAALPGARRETLATYIKRLENLENIASRYKGVKKCYALQAGREVRIIVEEDKLDDEASLMLARDIAKAIEEELNFPGQIKVNVIREKRSIEYAR